MADDIANPSGSSGDYENAALGVLNDESTDAPEVKETEEEGDETSSSEDTPPDYEDLPPEEEKPEEEKEEESTPEPEVKDEDLSLAGKKAYDKIKEKFPQVLKDVPELRQLFFQNKAYTDLFTSIDEARIAVNNSEFLDGLGLALNTGNIRNVFESLSENALNNLSEKFIPTLQQVNPKLFVKATGPLIANILNDAFESGSASGDKNLANAALWISKFLTGKPELPKRFIPKAEDPQLKSERERFEAEKQSFYQGQVNGFVNGADVAIEQGLNKVLMNGLVREGETLSSFMQQAIIKESINEIRNYTNKDKAFVSTMNELFRRAQKSGFDQDSKSRVVSAYLGRVKDIALKIRAQKKSEALGSQRKERSQGTLTQSQRQDQNPRNDRGRFTAPNRETASKDRPRTELDVIRSR